MLTINMEILKVTEHSECVHCNQNLYDLISIRHKSEILKVQTFKKSSYFLIDFLSYLVTIKYTNTM